MFRLFVFTYINTLKGFNAFFYKKQTKGGGKMENSTEAMTTYTNRNIEMFSQLTFTIAGIILAVSVLVMIIGGYKYVTSVGNPHETNRAKNHIVYAGIGVGLAMIAMLVVKVVLIGLGEPPTPSKEFNPAGLVIVLVIVFTLLFLLVYVGFAPAVKNEDEKKDKNNDPEAKQEVKPEPEEVEQTITMYDALMEPSLSNPFYHKLRQILTDIEHLRAKQSNIAFSIETLHQLNGGFERDMVELYTSYSNANDETKEQHEQVVMDSLAIIEQAIEQIHKEIESKNVYELEKSVKIIEKKYKKSN